MLMSLKCGSKPFNVELLYALCDINWHPNSCWSEPYTSEQSNKHCDLLECFVSWVQAEDEYYKSAEPVEAPRVKMFENRQPTISVAETIRYTSIYTTNCACRGLPFQGAAFRIPVTEGDF